MQSSCSHVIAVNAKHVVKQNLKVQLVVCCLDRRPAQYLISEILNLEQRSNHSQMGRQIEYRRGNRLQLLEHVGQKVKLHVFSFSFLIAFPHFVIVLHCKCGKYCTFQVNLTYNRDLQYCDMQCIHET